MRHHESRRTPYLGTGTTDANFSEFRVEALKDAHFALRTASREMQWTGQEAAHRCTHLQLANLAEPLATMESGKPGKEEFSP